MGRSVHAGLVVGKLKVLKRVSTIPGSQSTWLCECECGETEQVDYHMLYAHSKQRKKNQLACQKCSKLNRLFARKDRLLRQIGKLYAELGRVKLEIDAGLNPPNSKTQQNET